MGDIAAGSQIAAANHSAVFVIEQLPLTDAGVLGNVHAWCANAYRRSRAESFTQESYATRYLRCSGGTRSSGGVSDCDTGARALSSAGTVAEPAPSATLPRQ